MTGDPDPMAPFQPRPTPVSRGYWEGLRDGRVLARRCADCRAWMHPPLERCRRCGGPTAFEGLSGRGTVYSQTTTHKPVAPMYETPFVVAVVEMDEQADLRLVGRLLGVMPDDVNIGTRVNTEIEHLPGGDHMVVAFLPLGRETPTGSESEHE